MSFGKPVEKVEKAVEKSGESGIINLHDNSTDYKPVTQKSIDSVPLLNVFDDEAMNAAHQEASRDLLREVMRHDELPVGTEFSIVYDKDMKRIQGCDYRQGKVGSVSIDKPKMLYHAFHNHGSSLTFSVFDIKHFSVVDNMLSVTAVGNTGNQFVLVKCNDYDKYGFIAFVVEKTKEPLYIFNDIIISLESLYDKSISTMIRETIDSLNKEQFAELRNRVTQKCIEIAEGGADYGVKYKASELADRAKDI